MIQYIVQIDMAEFGENALWQDVEGAAYACRDKAYAMVEWMKNEYGDTIDYRVLARVFVDRKPVAQNSI